MKYETNCDIYRLFKEIEACAGLANMTNYIDTLTRQMNKRNRIIYRRKD